GLVAQARPGCPHDAIAGGRTDRAPASTVAFEVVPPAAVALECDQSRRPREVAPEALAVRDDLDLAFGLRQAGPPQHARPPHLERRLSRPLGRERLQEGAELARPPATLRPRACERSTCRLDRQQTSMARALEGDLELLRGEHTREVDDRPLR